MIRSRPMMKRQETAAGLTGRLMPASDLDVVSHIQCEAYKGAS